MAPGKKTRGRRPAARKTKRAASEQPPGRDGAAGDQHLALAPAPSKQPSVAERRDAKRLVEHVATLARDTQRRREAISATNAPDEATRLLRGAVDRCEAVNRDDLLRLSEAFQDVELRMEEFCEAVHDEDVMDEELYGRAVSLVERFGVNLYAVRKGTTPVAAAAKLADAKTTLSANADYYKRYYAEWQAGTKFVRNRHGRLVASTWKDREDHLSRKADYAERVKQNDGRPLLADDQYSNDASFEAEAARRAKHRPKLLEKMRELNAKLAAAPRVPGLRSYGLADDGETPLYLVATLQYQARPGFSVGPHTLDAGVAVLAAMGWEASEGSSYERHVNFEESVKWRVRLGPGDVGVPPSIWSKWSAKRRKEYDKRFEKYADAVAWKLEMGVPSSPSAWYQNVLDDPVQFPMPSYVLCEDPDFGGFEGAKELTAVA